MDGKRQMGSSSSSSLTSDLFGFNESSDSASPGTFGSIFAPSSQVGRESVRSEAVEKTFDSATQVWNSKPEIQETSMQRGEAGNQSVPNKGMCNFYQEQSVQPCQLSSSIYYGGQDIYSPPQNKHSSGYSTQFNKDGGEDDSGSASRGNWWQGSLYY